MNQLLKSIVFLCSLVIGSPLLAQDETPAAPREDASKSQVRVAYFLAYPREVAISFGEAGEIQGIMSGTVTGFAGVPAGSLPINIKDRFSKEQIFSRSVPAKGGDITNVLICGEPGNSAFPPSILSIKAEPKTRNTRSGDKKPVCELTFVNADHIGPLTVVLDRTEPPVSFSLEQGEQRTLEEVPAAASHFSIAAFDTEGKPDGSRLTSPQMIENVEGRLLVLLSRAAVDLAPVQMFIADLDSEKTYGDPDE